MRRRLPAVLAFLLLAAPVARGVEPVELLGRWSMEGEPARVLELKAGGTGTMDRLPLTWSVQGAKLTITDGGGTDTVAWKVTKDRLVLTVGLGSELVFLRAADGAAPRTPTPPSPRGGGRRG